MDTYQVFKGLSSDFLLTAAYLIVTFIAIILSSVARQAKKTIVDAIARFVSKVNSMEKDMTEMKAALVDHAKLIGNYKLDVSMDMNMNLDVIRSMFADSREKAFSKITELQELALELEVKTRHLADIFESNSKTLDDKLGIIVDTRRETRELFGRVIVVEDQISKHHNSLAQVATIFHKQGWIKGKPK